MEYHLKAVTDKLWSTYFLTDAQVKEKEKGEVTKRNKAENLLEDILLKVEQCPKSYYTFIEVLQFLEGDIHSIEEILQLLKRKYNDLSRGEHTIPYLL